MKQMNNRMALLLCFLASFFSANAQSISIDSCYQWAKNNYPLVKQLALIERSKEYSLANVQKGYLPQVNVSGYSTYQSDVLTFPFNLPGSSIDPLRKDQHRIYGEITQPITDLWNVKNQKELAANNADVESQKIEVELYKINERINQLFFGILLIEEQIKQTTLISNDLANAMQKVQAAVDNGTSLSSNLDLLKVEVLKVNQRIEELTSGKKAYLKMLEQFTGKSISVNTVLLRPSVLQTSESINRPELKLFSIQQKSFDIQSRILTNKTLPKLNFFFQGGYGAPGLNTIDNNPASYYYTGLRLNWNLSSFYTYKKERSLLDLNKRGFDIQKETFLLNTNLNISQQSEEVEKFKGLINSDIEIIKLRMNIKVNTEAQLLNGTITTFDFLTQINAEDQARQNLVLHQIQLLYAQYNLLVTKGK